MTRTVLLALTAWAMMLCASPDIAYADTPSTAAPVTPDTDTRLTQLAQKLSTSTPSARQGVLPAQALDDPTPSLAAGETPLFVGTPLLRRDQGSTDDSEKAQPVGTTSRLLKTLTALGVVIGLALLIRIGYARWGGKIAATHSPVVEVLSRTSVAPRSHVMLLRVGGRVLVVSDSSAGMRTLANVEDPEEVAGLLAAVSAAKPTSISRGFSQLFARFNEEHDRQQAEHEGAGTQGHFVDTARGSVLGLLARVRGLGRGEGTR